MQDTRWIFARHGQSVANRDGWLAGRVDSPLTAAGRDQARRLGEALAVTPASVVASPLARALDTARLAAPGRSPVPVPELAERHLGIWEGTPRLDLRESGHMDVLLSWSEAPPGGESQLDVARRALRWFAAARLPGPVLAVCHGGVLRAVLGLLDGLPLDEIGRTRIPHAASLERTVSASTWTELIRSLEVPP